MIDPPDRSHATMVKRHLRLGWWSLLAFLLVGLGLEALHGFKVGLYLDVDNETRRLLWTLGHAHGVLLALVHVAFGVTCHVLAIDEASSKSRLASRCLTGSLLLLPAGFLLGGAFLHGNDPGYGILLVPPGGLLLAIGVFLTAKAT